MTNATPAQSDVSEPASDVPIDRGLEREVERQLAAAGARYTAKRRHVVGTLHAAEGPLSAGELHAAMRHEVPLSTLYRTLSVLEEAGVVEPHHGARGMTRYELAESIAGHHHHLVCIDCGSVDDVTVSERHESDLEELVDRIGSVTSFRPTGHVLEIEGLCARCA